VKAAVYIGGVLGMALLVVLVVRADFSAMLHTLDTGGLQILWLAPYRTLYFVLYAWGWLLLLRPYDSMRRARFGYVFWVTTVREGVDRLLPVASVGGGVVGIRLLRWRGLPAAPVAATVIVEVVLTLSVVYAFTAIGLFLLFGVGVTGEHYRRLAVAFGVSLPVPILTILLLRYGSAFQRLQRFFAPLLGEMQSDAAASLDQEVRATLGRRWTLLAAAGLQLAALIFGSFEIWFAMRLFGHPVNAATAVALESMTQAVRHVGFFVPAGLGIQEAGLVLFGAAFGISAEVALAVSMAKRLREVLCGVPAILSWQYLEGRRLSGAVSSASQ
jgi:putative membrane protein